MERMIAMGQILTADGHVTILADIGRRLGLKPGDAVEFAVNDHDAVLGVAGAATRQDMAANDTRLRALAGIINLQGKGTHDAIGWLRGDGE
jgi:hypothetical protein